MTPSWFSPQTVGGILAVLLFGAMCASNMRLAILVFTAAGCIRNVQIGAFAGSEMVQGLLPVEALATVMFLTWLAVRGVRPPRYTPFNTALFLLFPASVVSLIAGFVAYDPNIAVDHMKMSVSLGQVLLTMWPVATYLVVANAVNDTKTIATIRKIIIVLAIPSLLLIVSPSTWKYVDWSTSFALPASSLCVAELFEKRSTARKVGLLIIALAPLAYGLAMGKAFYYAYVLVSTGVIVSLRMHRGLLILIPVALAMYVVAVPLASGSLTPQLFNHLVEEEEEQQSLGGTGGRDQLIKDGLGIWSRSPVLGVGPGNNYPYMLRYSSLGTAHNQYVNILIELGVVGLLVFAAFAYQALRMGLKLWRTARDPVHRNLVLSWFGIFAGFLVGGFFGDFMLPSIRNGGLELFAEFYVQWIILGLVVSAAAIERSHMGRIKIYEYA